MTDITKHETCYICGTKLEYLQCLECAKEKKPENLDLTSSQKEFVQRAKENLLRVDYGYSGRYMFGETCPSVVVDDLRDFPYSEYPYDQLGRGSWVIYCSC